MTPILAPDEEKRLLPHAQARLDDATRAVVRQAIAAGRFEEALTTLRREMRRLIEEQEHHTQA